MKKLNATRNLIFCTIALLAYLIMFFIINFKYITELNQYFIILNKNAEMISAVNASRYDTNLHFILIEKIFGGIGIVLSILEGLCVYFLVRAYKSVTVNMLTNADKPEVSTGQLKIQQMKIDNLQSKNKELENQLISKNIVIDDLEKTIDKLKNA